MGDSLIRVVVAAVAVAAVAATGFIGRRRRRRETAAAPLDLTGIEGQILFFSDAHCRRCDIVRRRLQRTGAEFTEISLSDEAGLHRRVGVLGVPLVVVRVAGGTEVARLAGVVGRRRIEAAIRGATVAG